MRIHTRIEIDIETGRIVKEEGFNYDGPLAQCGGGSSAPAAPAKTAEETNLLKTQNDLLTQQLIESKQMTPLLMRQMGLKQDASGDWVEKTWEEKEAVLSPAEKAANKANMLKYGLDTSGNKLTEEQLMAEMTPLEKLNYQTTKLSTERYNQAMTGTLPISPALESELTAEETQAQEVLSRKLGPSWMLSTPGQKAMSTLKQKANLVREEARRGEISAGDVRFQNSVSSAITKNNQATNDLSTALSAKQGVISNMANIPGRNTGTMSNAERMMGPYAKDRDLAYSAELQTQANNAAASQGTTQLVSTGAAAAAAAAAA